MTTHRSRKRVADDEIASIRQWSERGDSDEQIAAKLGRSPSSIRHIRSEIGATQDPAREWTDCEIAMLHTFHGRGLGLEEQARRLGRTVPAVARQRRLEGLYYRKRAVRLSEATDEQLLAEVARRGLGIRASVGG